jgi:pimeloyl-ACP methyl ester carboxylesterase
VSEPVHDTRVQVDGRSIFLRRAGDDAVPVLYLHGVPTSSDDWLAFLALTGGMAPDLPGFGRSAKRIDDEGTMASLGAFPGALLDALGIERVRLVVHDWGAAGLIWAQRQPERVERLVVINAVPLLPGYRWHRTARLWRTRGVGELSMGLTTPAVFRLFSRESNATRGPMPRAFLDSVAAHLDQGTQRAILRLYRSAPPDALAAAGARLDAIAAPALVLWGTRDPYLPRRFGAAYAEALGDARLEELEDAGHWPWIDRPEVVERVARFLDGRDGT